MSQRPVTIDDIYELLRESERQRKEQQQNSEREMAELRKIVAQTNKQVGGVSSRWGRKVYL